MIASHPSLPVRRVADLISLAKRNPGQINFGSSGTGGLPHLSGELFKRLAGIDMVHVPYKGSAQAVTDTMAGQVQVIFDLMPSTLPHVKTGRLRGIAVCSKTRSNAAADIPTVIESGLPNYEVTSWFGVLTPAKTSRDIVAQLHAEINRIIGLPDVSQQFAIQGAEPMGNTPEQFRQLIREDITRWSEVIRIAGARIE
jgi:tripartite-type tricarboxylate transporter receptor subunit TctC